MAKSNKISAISWRITEVKNALIASNAVTNLVDTINAINAIDAVDAIETAEALEIRRKNAKYHISEWKSLCGAD